MARGVEGINPNLVLFDEIHAMRTRSLYDAMAYSSAARPDSLLLSVSTVGIADQSLIWWEQYDYTKKLLEGAIIDPHCFGYLRQADEACVDDFEKCGDEEQWFKAMPSLGHTVQVETIRQHYTEAKNSPAKQNAFRRYLLNIPTQQIDRVVPMSEWYSCQSDVPDLMGRHCFGGLDLASHEDLSSFCLYFPPILSSEDGTEEQPAFVLSNFFCPADKINERKASGMAFYSQWVDEGWLTISGGARIDANPIQDVIREASEFYQIDQIGFDPWGADAVVNDLIDEGIPLVAVGQSMRGMTTGVRTLLDDIAEAKIHHDGNPVMSWCLANCASDEKSDGGIRFSKKKSADKIDGAVALAMARGRAVDNANKSNKQPEIFF
jgi:phage terminase large subunit-like protein